jgi:hypothetical protein
MEMRRTTVHRGVVALAIVTSLALAGARPAAARELGALERFHLLWASFVGAPSAAPGFLDKMGDKLTGWFGGVPTKAVSAPPPASPDKGWGMDPNGSTVNSTTPPTTVAGGN